MRVGLSTYSLLPLIKAGQMSPMDVIDWVARQGGEHVEIVPFGFLLRQDDTGEVNGELISALKRKSRDAGIPLVCYSILANLCVEGEAFEREISRIMAHVDVAAELGVPMMRHDISAFRRPIETVGISYFSRELPQMAEAAGRIADHAKARGITTLLENHGFYVNGSDRVGLLLDMVGRENYGLMLDTGNFLCVDEPAEAAAARLAKRARYVHLKDFYLRHSDPGDATQFDCAGSWFRTVNGDYLRGSILGQGDIDVPRVLSVLKSAGFNGDLTIEFEGLEEPRYASKVSMDNARRIWNSI